MSTSSAHPDHLEQFTHHAAADTAALASSVHSVLAQVEDFAHRPSTEVGVPATAVLVTALTAYVADSQDAERFVGAVRQAFVDADQAVLPDSKIVASLRSARVAGTDADIPTVESPGLLGAPPETGWVQDAVCVATGHLHRFEPDLPMPPTLRQLAWGRSYNSRFVTEGALGAGWSTWADVRLSVDDESISLHGPDGQRGVWHRHQDTLLPPSDVEASLELGKEGVVLHWPWTSRWPGATWTFDADGILRRIAHPGEGVIEFDRDGLRLVGMRHDGGRSLSLVWDNDRMVGVASSDGRRVDYQFRDGQLVEARRPAGSIRYGYDVGLVTQVTDADNVALVRATYDHDGRVTTLQSALDRTTVFDYLGRLTVLVRDNKNGPRCLFRHDHEGRLVDMTSPTGAQLVRYFDLSGHLTRVVGLGGDEVLRRYDKHGNLVWERRPDGTEWRWTYDAAGRITSAIDPVGTVRTARYDGDHLLPSSVRGPLGWHVELTASDGRLTSITDADGVRWAFSLDPDGQVVAIEDGLGEVTELQRHPSGRITGIVAPTGERLTAEHDDAGRFRSFRRPDGREVRVEDSPGGRRRAIVGPGGARTELAWGPDGKLAVVLDPEGGITTLGHDAFGNLAFAERADGGRWELKWDELGQLSGFVDPTGASWHQSWTVTGHWLGVSDPSGLGARHRLDRAGRVVGVEPLGAEAEAFGRDGAGRVVETVRGDHRRIIPRDPLGRVLEVRLDSGRSAMVTYTPAGRVASLTSGDCRWSYDYDRAGRLARVTLPSGQTREITRDRSGRPVTITSEHEVRRLDWKDGLLVAVTVNVDVGAGEWLRESTRLDYDPSGRLSGITNSEGARVAYGWDRVQRLASVTDANGATTTVTRRSDGEPVALTDPLGRTWHWEADAAGRPVALVDPLGRRMVATLDEAGRPVAVRTSDGTETGYVWHEGELQAVTLDGQEVARYRRDRSARALEATTSTGEVTRVTWDRQGRLTARSELEQTVLWFYDNKHVTKTVVLSSGDAMVEHRDDLGRVDWVQHPALGKVRATFEDDRLVRLIGPDLRRSWTYRGPHLMAYRETIERGPDGERSDTEIHLTRDSSGRVVAEDRNGKLRRYSYDAAGRLVGADGPSGSWAWTYDPAGRLVAEAGPAGERRFHYDAADQLTAIDGPEGTTTFVYDRLGRRVAERRADGSVDYDWGPLGHLATISRTTSGGSTSTRIGVDAFGQLTSVGQSKIDWSEDGRRLLSIAGRSVVSVAGSPIATVADGQAEYLSVDWRTTPLTGLADVWGRPDGAPADEPAIGYLGEVGFGGLVWLRNRVYDTSTRSYLSRDPLCGMLGTPGSPSSPYVYARNDPIGHADPMGLQPLSMTQYRSWRAGEESGQWSEVSRWMTRTIEVAGSRDLGIGGAPSDLYRSLWELIDLHGYDGMSSSQLVEPENEDGLMVHLRSLVYDAGDMGTRSGGTGQAPIGDRSVSAVAMWTGDRGRPDTAESSEERLQAVSWLRAMLAPGLIAALAGTVPGTAHEAFADSTGVDYGVMGALVGRLAALANHGLSSAGTTVPSRVTPMILASGSLPPEYGPSPVPVPVPGR